MQRRNRGDGTASDRERALVLIAVWPEERMARAEEVTIGAAALAGILRDICRAAGSQPDEAQAVADNLVEANLVGHDSHGVGMLPSYVEAVCAGALKPNTHARIVSETESIAVLDGGLGYGQVVGAEAIDRAIAKARAAGLALVGLRHAHHLGRIGAWAERCAVRGLVSIHFVNVANAPSSAVAPHGGVDRRLGTNPVCIGVPAAGGEPVVLDMATSRIAIGKIRVARNSAKRIPEGCLIDAAGAPTTDPNAWFDEPRGALLPAGEHKGYGLSLMCDLLAGAVMGGGTIPAGGYPPAAIVNNMFSVVADPAALGTGGGFRDEVARVVNWIKTSRPEGGVLAPGERGRCTRERRLRAGIPIDGGTWSDLVRAGARVDVTVAAP